MTRGLPWGDPDSDPLGDVQDYIAAGYAALAPELRAPARLGPARQHYERGDAITLDGIFGFTVGATLEPGTRLHDRPGDRHGRPLPGGDPVTRVVVCARIDPASTAGDVEFCLRKMRAQPALRDAPAVELHVDVEDFGYLMLTMTPTPEGSR